MVEVVRRRPWLAALLGVFPFPAGFMYVGRLGVGLLALALGLVAIAVLGWSGVLHDAHGWLAAFAVLAGLLLFQVAYPFVLARRTRDAYPLRWYNRWYHYIWICLVVLLAADVAMVNRGALFGYESFRQASSLSMAPALLPGDVVFADTRPSTIAGIARGDVVVFEHPSGAPFAKRLVGLPGDRVEAEGQELRVNGVVVADPMVMEAGEERDFGDFSLTVPPGRMFVLGDNRGRSMDSRQEGPYEYSSLIGKVTRIWYSPDSSRIGPVR